MAINTPINFKFPLGRGVLGMFDTNNNTKDAVKENLKLTILTSKGERLVKDIGSSYHFDLFKQQKEEVEEGIKDHTQEIFEQYFQFLKLDNIEILTAEDNNAIEDNQVLVRITYSFRGIENFSDELQIILS